MDGSRHRYASRGSGAITEPLTHADEEALLRRPVRPLMTNADRDAFAGQRCMVTGAGGSIGSELARQIELQAKPLSGTAGARNPFFSPDGQWLGFFADGKLKKISVTGGAPHLVRRASRSGPPRSASGRSKSSPARSASR